MSTSNGTGLAEDADDDGAVGAPEQDGGEQDGAEQDDDGRPGQTGAAAPG